MFTIYLACLIFGGILLGFSLFFSGDHDSDIDAETEIDIHSEDVHIQEISSDSSRNLTDSIQFFSLRNIIYFMTFFGLTGTIFDLLDFNELLTLITSIGLGSFAWLFGYKLIKYLKKSDSGETFNINDLKGIKGKIVLEVYKNRKGKVFIEFKGSNYELPAKLIENSEFDKLKFGDEILVVDVQEGIAIIDKFDL